MQIRITVPCIDFDVSKVGAQGFPVPALSMKHVETDTVMEGNVKVNPTKLILSTKNTHREAFEIIDYFLINTKGHQRTQI